MIENEKEIENIMKTGMVKPLETENADFVKQEIVKKETPTDVIPKNMSDRINATMQEYMKGGLQLPNNYNVNNAVLSGYLQIVQDDKLKACSPVSIQTALIQMATLGLNPSKSQCYFVPYGGKLNLQLSYFGKQTAIKRIKGVVDVRADVIYKGTKYELEVDDFGNDKVVIKEACPLDERSFTNIIGAWAKIILDKEVWGTDEYSCVMTMEQIEKAWNQGQMKGKSPAHLNFRDEMAKKTVINRCIKNYINSRDDQDIIIQTINETTANDYEYEDVDAPREMKVIDI